jgi:hypothetical protein
MANVRPFIMEALGKRYVLARFIPQLLRHDKKKCLFVASYWFECAETNENSLKIS